MTEQSVKMVQYVFFRLRRARLKHFTGSREYQEDIVFYSPPQVSLYSIDQEVLTCRVQRTASIFSVKDLATPLPLKKKRKFGPNTDVVVYFTSRI
jgi:hypothetical protein